MTRCRNKNHKDYKYYGARGISVCKRWIKFEEFIEDMGFKPDPSYKIERVNNDSGYSPENCIWSTAKSQQRNRRNTIILDYEGKRLSLPEWAENLGIKYDTLRGRIRRRWSIKEALTRPICYKKNQKKGGGK